MSLHYSCNEQTGAVCIWDGSTPYADLTHCSGNFEERVQRAREIASAVNAVRYGVPEDRLDASEWASGYRAGVRSDISTEAREMLSTPMYRAGFMAGLDSPESYANADLYRCSGCEGRFCAEDLHEGRCQLCIETRVR